jgi:hypothetical protein
MSATENSSTEAWLENKAMCFALHGNDLQHDDPHGGLQLGERSSMVEDAPTSTKHGHLSRVRGTVPGEVIVKGIR